METFFLYIFPLSSNHDEERGTCMFLSFFPLFLSSVFSARKQQLLGTVVRYSEDRGQTANCCCSKYHSISSNCSTVGYLRCLQSIGFTSITNPLEERKTNCKTFQEKPATHNVSTISRSVFCILCRQFVFTSRI